ncbi:hypothetical protein [Haloplanus salilacus]|uniref:hypothetical protein n=1 Tax=Haloplanus salilacus TaxID=2949994 RepID=UPI0030CE785B
MSDSTDADPPRRWVEAFYDSEREVRSVLDDVREAHLLGEYDEVRDRLRALAEAETGIFQLVALTVLDLEGFYDDLDDQYDDGESPPTEELRALGDEYGRLADDLELVFTERVNGLQNPMPALKCGFGYSNSTNLPRLDYDLYSGDVALCEFVHPPSQSLRLARSIVASTGELLRRVEENDDTIAEAERERLAAVCRSLREDVAEVDEFVADDEVAEADPSDVYDDWSFY